MSKGSIWGVFPQNVWFRIFFFGLWARNSRTKKNIFNLVVKTAFSVYRGTFWLKKLGHVNSKLANHRRKRSTFWGRDFPFVIYITTKLIIKQLIADQYLFATTLNCCYRTTSRQKLVNAYATYVSWHLISSTWELAGDKRSISKCAYSQLR